MRKNLMQRTYHAFHYGVPKSQLADELCTQAGLDHYYALHLYHRSKIPDEASHLLFAALQEIYVYMAADLEEKGVTIYQILCQYDNNMRTNNAVYYMKHLLPNFRFSEDICARVREWAASRKPTTIAQWEQAEVDYWVENTYYYP